ncbi:hypothetical protein SAMN04488048_13222 [Trichococcus flocculiformis]|uniref:MobP2 family relaxase n=1 Tax=Trichococcus TaxID=82802 RepID=UPI0007A8FC9F|nr:MULTISPECIES: MobP2 family relaxase [Trichococcus]CZR09838.1 Hypothetical protein TES5_2764 [Trichococcus sp. ES5]SHG15230.1 hypothetical protein SAMN04488048_13222 [Trichococcus flocculiformis]
MTTPAFVLKSEFELPGTNTKGYAGIVDYMTDKEKVKKGEAYNTPDYFPEGILSYMSDEKKASGLFTKDKDFVDKNSIRELKESYQQAEQNGSLQWKFVGSFDNEWLKENQILNPDGEVREQALKKSVRVMMDRLIKEEKFIPSQTIWAASFHHNTDNLHFHISLVEKENSRELVKRRKQKVEKSLSPTGMQLRFYRDQGAKFLQPKGKLKQATLEKMKSAFLNELTRPSRRQTLEKQTALRDNLVQELQLPQETFTKRKELLRILQVLPQDKKKWQYKTIRREYPLAKNRIDAYTKNYLKKSGKQEEFQRIVKEEADFRARLYGGSHDYQKNQMADLEYRLGNRLLKELQLQLQEKNRLRSVSRSLYKEQHEEISVESIRFTLRDRRRLDRAMGDTYQKKLNLLYYEQSEREAERVRRKQEYGLE